MESPVEKLFSNAVLHLLAEQELIRLRTGMAALSGLRPELKAANDAWLAATK